MKLGKCKQALADLINANGGWVDGDAIFAAMDGNGDLFGYSGRPQWTVSHGHWYGHTLTCWFFSPIVINNHHQTILSREEYYQAYPKADDDGWIEWNGGECPVDVELYVYVNYRDGCVLPMVVKAGSQRWDHFGLGGDIVSYRLRNHANMHDTVAGDPNPVAEPEFCESVMRSIPEPEFDDAGSRLAKALELVKSAAPHMLRDKYKFDGNEVMGERKPTIEQLAQDYRNKLDLANRKQQDADDAKSAADAALGELERAGEALGLVVTQVREDRTQNPIIADFRYLKIGDAVRIVRDNIGGRYNGYEGRVAMIDPDDTRTPVLVNLSFGTMWCHDVEFIR